MKPVKCHRVFYVKKYLWDSSVTQLIQISVENCKSLIRRILIRLSSTEQYFKREYNQSLSRWLHFFDCAASQSTSGTTKINIRNKIIKKNSARWGRKKEWERSAVIIYRWIMLIDGVSSGRRVMTHEPRCSRQVLCGLVPNFFCPALKLKVLNDKLFCNKISQNAIVILLSLLRFLSQFNLQTFLQWHPLATPDCFFFCEVCLLF